MFSKQFSIFFCLRIRNAADGRMYLNFLFRLMARPDVGCDFLSRLCARSLRAIYRNETVLDEAKHRRRHRCHPIQRTQFIRAQHRELERWFNRSNRHKVNRFLPFVIQIISGATLSSQSEDIFDCICENCQFEFHYFLKWHLLPLTAFSVSTRPPY